MRIGIDMYRLLEQPTGIGIYILNILKALEKIDKENEYFLFCNHKFKPPFLPNSRWRIYIGKGFFNRSYTFWLQTQVRKELMRNNIDIFWGACVILPLNLPPAIKTILTVHHLPNIYHYNTLKWKNRIIFLLFFERSLKKAGQVIAISEFTAKELKKSFQGIDNKISAILHGVAADQFFPRNKLEARDYISLKFKVLSKYILAVATLEPRKNLDNLLRAYAVLIKDRPNFDCQLLIAGGKGWLNKNIYKAYKKLGLSERQVKFLGYVSDIDLGKLYSGAEAFISPSLYEGFGLPNLEAMACGIPVIASDIPVFREILGDAALFVNPYNPDEIADGIYRVLIDKELAERLKEKGLERVKLFSWEKAAKETLKVFRQVYQSKLQD